jgi:2-hydroxychromene-2-carboxylate isomerase
MPRTIEFYFDFASPYAYFSLARLEALAQARGCTIAWRPILLWAVRQRFEMIPPMEDGPRADYIRNDMMRSAAFHDVPFVLPDSFGRSTHLAARLLYGLGESRPELVPRFAHAVFEAHFVCNGDIADARLLAGVGAVLGLPHAVSERLMTEQSSRDALAAAIDEAGERQVWGSPFFFLDGEAFFGADRLPQLDWRLAGKP